jgi:hypothetical protein
VGNTEGVYTAQSNGRRYSYSASWTMAFDVLIWSATVRTIDGEVAGRPGGHILDFQGLETDPEVVVSEQIKSAIEVGLAASAPASD